MKRPIIFACLLVMTAFFFSCHKSNLNYEKDFNKSYNAWLSFKETSGNSYRYSVTGGSWTGFGWQTTITVTDGKVTERHYKLAPPPGSTVTIPADKLEWTETGNEIGTHDGSAAALTLDEVYERARTEWLVKRSGAKTYFEAKNNGMLSSCGYVKDGCVDDCFTGISISSIQAL